MTHQTEKSLYTTRLLSTSPETPCTRVLKDGPYVALARRTSRRRLVTLELSLRVYIRQVCVG